jgi:hypothetical protein
MIMAFKKAVDCATRDKLRLRMTQNPNLTLAMFRAELKREFVVDARKQHRQA